MFCLDVGLLWIISYGSKIILVLVVLCLSLGILMYVTCINIYAKALVAQNVYLWVLKLYDGNR